MRSLGEQRVPSRLQLSRQGRAVLMREHFSSLLSLFSSQNARVKYCVSGSFERCPFPTREQKDALLREVLKTDPEYSRTKLIHWFTNQRRCHPESRKERKGGGKDAVSALLDPRTSLACEMWPSLSAEILNCLHTMLLKQPLAHPTAQHKELLAKLFNVEREHVENFLSWRITFLTNEDNVVWQGNSQWGRKPLSTPPLDDDKMELDELLESGPYLPTPAGSTSPEPVCGMTPFIRAKISRRESLDVGPFTPGEHGPNSPISPGPMIEPSSLSCRPTMHILSNATPRQASSPMTTYFLSPVSHIQRSPTGPTLVSPLSLPQSTCPNAPSATSSPRTSTTRQESRSRTGTHASSNVASSEKPSPQAPGPATRIPRTLHDFEEAYAPTYARIERFLRDVESNKLTHLGLTPEMLK